MLCHRLLLLTIAVTTLFASDAFPMRDRIFCDHEAGISFRFPYRLHIADQYRGIVIDGTGTVQVQVHDRDTLSEAELAAEVRRLGQIKREVAHLYHGHGEDIADLDDAALITVLTGTAATDLQPHDYYSDSTDRPFASSSWAPDDITAVSGRLGERLILLLRYPYRSEAHAAALVVRDNDDGRAILASCEVLKAARRKPGTTWREYQCMKKSKVFTADGRALSAKTKSSTVAWDQAWEIESEHYHLTGTVAPKRLMELANLLEGLYDAYCGVFEPETMPPYKLEIHIADTVHDFAALGEDHGYGPIATGENGSLMGGFFAPGSLSIFTYNEPVAGYPTRVEKTLAHEASHQFLHVTCNGSSHVPTWINEGLAVYFESSELTGRRSVWHPPHNRLKILKQHYSRAGTTLQPLANYLDHYGHIPAANYGEVYAMTHFWVFASKRGRELFHDYWQALKSGENGNDAFTRIFMSEMIEGQGSRQAALTTWQKLLIRYVLEDRPTKVK
ncbi:MAG: DUF1570 domain-containing protein [Planctomycetota bacterium]|jgi:hypothetical protein